MSKYDERNLLPALRLFIDARNKALETGFTDNGGAIHSVERILDILCVRVCYGLTHINNLKRDPAAEISVAAHNARERGEPVLIERVKPQRAFARDVIERVYNSAIDDQLIRFIKRNYRLVLLIEDEMLALNRINRSKLTKDRIAEAGIKLYRSK